MNALRVQTIKLASHWGECSAVLKAKPAAGSITTVSDTSGGLSIINHCQHLNCWSLYRKKEARLQSLDMDASRGKKIKILIGPVASTGLLSSDSVIHDTFTHVHSHLINRSRASLALAGSLHYQGTPWIQYTCSIYHPSYVLPLLMRSIIFDYITVTTSHFSQLFDQLSDFLGKLHKPFFQTLWVSDVPFQFSLFQRLITDIG